MKTLHLSIDDALYDHLMGLIKQLPKDKIQIIDEKPTEEADTPFSEAIDYVLDKNSELYRRLS